jgi:hypothetical protein
MDPHALFAICWRSNVRDVMTQTGFIPRRGLRQTEESRHMANKPVAKNLETLRSQKWFNNRAVEPVALYNDPI